MRTFEDRHGRKWEFEISVGSIKRVHAQFGIDLTDFGEDGVLKSLVDDPIKLVDMFWLLLEDQAEKNGSNNEPVNAEDFGKAFTGPVIEKATIQFIEALIEFFPSEAKRNTARKIFAKTNSLVEKGLKLIDAKVDDLDVDKILKDAMAE